MKRKRFTAFFESPIGTVAISGSDKFITEIIFTSEAGEDSENLPENILVCKKELQNYFQGNRREFSVATKPEGSDFQKRVWEELKNIKYGETLSYGDIAKRIDDKNASRAVGHANGKNPIAVIIPCHSVVGETGKLTGYSGGMWRKQWLLDLEGNVSGKNLTLF